jgi:hypothetical protein
LRLWSLCAAFLAWAVPAQSAEIAKYLPDDTDAVVTANIRQVLASPQVKKEYGAMLQQLLTDNKQVAAVFRHLGLDPLKDIDRLTLALGESAYRIEGAGNGAAAAVAAGAFPYVVVQGKFDLAKFHARAERAARDQPNILKIVKMGEVRICEVNLGAALGTPLLSFPVFVGLPDQRTLVASVNKDQVVDAFDRAAGKKNGTLKNKELGPLVAAMDLNQAVAVAVSADTVWERGVSVQSVNGVTTVTTIQKTLGEMGIQALTGGITLTEMLKAEFRLTAKDADKAKDIGKAIEETAEAVGATAKKMELPSVLEVLKTIKVTAKDKTLSVQGQGSLKAIQSLIQDLGALKAD